MKDKKGNYSYRDDSENYGQQFKKRQEKKYSQPTDYLGFDADIYSALNEEGKRKEKGNNRRANKFKDRDKYDKFDDWD